MNDKELRRGEVLGRVKRGELKLSEAARILDISYRQTKRIWKRYSAGGTQALQHGNVGRVSYRAKPAAVRQQVLQLVREHYSGEPHERFGPTLAAEHLWTDHGLKLSVRTLRRWMLAAGLWSRQRQRKAHRKRRQRKAHFGELIQAKPDNADYWLHQANAYLGLAEATKAATNYEVVRRMGKADAKVLNQLADIYINEGTYDLAFAAYQDAAAADEGREVAPPIRAADILISVGEFDRGNSLLAQIRSIHKNQFNEADRLKILQLEARVQLANGEEAKAIKTLEQIVDKDPLDGESLLLLADYYGRNDNVEKAGLFYQRAEQLDDFEVRAKITHAQFLVHRSQYAKAVPLLKSAQAKRPRDSVQRYLDQVVKLARLAKG